MLPHEQVLANGFANENYSLIWFMKPPPMAISLPFFSLWVSNDNGINWRVQTHNRTDWAPSSCCEDVYLVNSPCLGSSVGKKWTSFLYEPLRVWVCCLSSGVHLPQNPIYSQKHWHPRTSSSHVTSSHQSSSKWWKHHTSVLAKTYMWLSAHMSLISWSEST